RSGLLNPPIRRGYLLARLWRAFAGMARSYIAGFARLCGALPLRPCARGVIPLRTPLARVPACPCRKIPVTPADRKARRAPRSLPGPSGHGYRIFSAAGCNEWAEKNRSGCAGFLGVTFLSRFGPVGPPLAGIAAEMPLLQ